MTFKIKHDTARIVAAALLLTVLGADNAGAADSVGVNDTDSVIGQFDISRFNVTGSTLIGSAEIQSLLAAFTGKNRSFAAIQQAQEALEEAYRARGYSLVRVALPEQVLDQGVVRLQVVESRIVAIAIEGNTQFSNANIRRSLPNLQTGVSPQMDQISANLKMANENPAKKLNLKMQQGANDGELLATLAVTEEKPWRVGLNLDNSGNSTTGRTNVGVLYQHANLSGHDDVISVQYNTTLEHPGKVGIYGAGYHLPLYAQGDAIDLFASHSSVDSGSVSAGIFNLQVSGKGTVVGGRYNLNLARQGDYESKLVFGFDYKAYENNVTLSGAQLGNDITVHPISIGYVGTWIKPVANTNFYVTALRNIPGGDNGSTADFASVRSEADAGYAALRYGGSVSEAFASGWQWRVQFNGQATGDALVPGEQFGAGGAYSVRGFSEREIAGDKGNFFGTEVQTPELCQGVSATNFHCHVVGFYDSATVRRNKSLPGERRSESIAGAGLGMRIAVSNYLAMQIDLGRVLDAGGTRKTGDQRLHFTMALSY